MPMPAAHAWQVVWAEAEHGPPPYLQTLPFTKMPVADLWDVNLRVARQAARPSQGVHMGVD